MPTPQYQAKRPVTALAGPYGHPLHPILVTVPIGAWVTSLLFDLASHVVPDPGFLARGSLWLIAIGVIGALAAALYGIACAWRAGAAAGTGAGPMAPVHIALSVVALAALTVSGHLGGKLAYRYGLRVADETTQAAGFRS
ncbi:DUF2231 domain-containing protein [Nonomuraea roseoviolacea]|uniref:Membrane protein n=1 Tax=Nonomuraea roseoviolacea subsp. carminata TaxID=160689 RepID=A0ABT1K2G3_9ACTN|nr:DUF2231 domain-containing protein [Nonomuraea roseoviolacea]MCP2348198.1 putative membrane protein [Nonomuraea roseoviolacea subsp. carminata]